MIFGQLRLFLTTLLPAHRANDKAAMQNTTGCVLCMICAAMAAREATGNPSHDLLLTKSAVERAAILGKAVGSSCIGMTPFFMGMAEDGSALWSVLCADGSAYALNISPDAAGTTRALECSRLKAMHLDCFSPLPAEALRRPTEGPVQLPTERLSVPAPAPSPPTVLRGGNGR
jgi:hypothetical protein